MTCGRCGLWAPRPGSTRNDYPSGETIENGLREAMMKKCFAMILVLIGCVVFQMSVVALSAAEEFRLDLREEILRGISGPIMEVYYEDFSKDKKIPDLGQGWSDQKMTEYFTEFFFKAEWEPDSWSAKVVKLLPDSKKFTVSKAIIDGLAQVFHRENLDLNKFLVEGFSARLDAQGQTWTVTGPGLYGYHNNESFDYNLNGVKISGDTATVTYNTCYSKEIDEHFSKISNDSCKNPNWSFDIKPGLFKIHYKMIDGRLVLVKTELQTLKPFKFFTQ